jgi:hypothetical protein
MRCHKKSIALLDIILAPAGRNRSRDRSVLELYLPFFALDCLTPLLNREYPMPHRWMGSSDMDASDLEQPAPAYQTV